MASRPPRSAMAPRMGAALEASCPVLSLCPLRPPERPPPLPVGWCSVRDAPFGRGEYCQSCVPHVTCFPLLSCPYLVSSCSCPRLSPLVSTCVLIAPHLFQFSSFDFLVFKSPVSPVSCVRDYMSPCVLLKSMFENSPGLLAPCSLLSPPRV